MSAATVSFCSKLRGTPSMVFPRGKIAWCQSFLQR